MRADRTRARAEAQHATADRTTRSFAAAIAAAALAVSPCVAGPARAAGPSAEGTQPGPSAGLSKSRFYRGSGAFPVAIGEVGPIAPDNPRQQPFGCQTFKTPLGQPQVDNQEGVGLPVTDPGGPPPAGGFGALEESEIAGYSADCGAPTEVNHFYRSTDTGALEPLPAPGARPDDLATLEVDGRTVDYIVRHEIGTLNRFIYSIYVLEPDPADPAEPDLSVWNRNLIFSFGGGVGIGRSQSNGFITSFVTRPDGRDLHVPLLERGYAIVASTGTGTNTTYNLLLTGQTAAMVKRQFVTAYAEPDHTFGLGGSGGAIQQYIYEQNIPDLLDALLPLETFGDMITQINPVGDCELLEFYFDRGHAAVQGSLNPFWADWESRQKIEGLNAINGAPTDWDNPLDAIERPIGSTAQAGTSECVEGWRGLTPVVLNPGFAVGDTYELIRETHPDVYAETRFDYFDDLKHIFGTDPKTGFALTTYDNVGVQYGLAALRRGEITVPEFLRLNAHVGGWKDLSQMQPAGFPFGPLDPSKPNANIDPWSSRQATAVDHLAPGDVAPRREADLAAVRRAYNAGLVFLGDIDDPMIIIDAYREPDLDMHHSREKFEIRARMLEADGDASNLALWAIDGEEDQPVLGRILEGLALLESWLETGSKPAAATDACFAADGAEIARGAGVWAGVDTDDPGDDAVCAERFPIFPSSRIVAGERLTSLTFKCALKPVDEALADGTYGGVDFSAAEEARLREIFPDGVCDYTKPDEGRPGQRTRGF